MQTTDYNANELVQFQQGTIPIILTSPHGGKLALPGVQVRSRAGCCNISDSNTNLVVDLVAQRLESLYGLKPYFVKGLAKRKYCDLNRHSGMISI
jgi:N-formylglutamate amidohydrolase